MLVVKNRKNKQTKKKQNMLSQTFSFSTASHLWSQMLNHVKTFSGNVYDCSVKATTALDVGLVQSVQQVNASICGWLTAANTETERC